MQASNCSITEKKKRKKPSRLVKGVGWTKNMGHQLKINDWCGGCGKNYFNIEPCSV